MPSIDVGIGALLVLLAANERFNTPTSNRSSTTAIRYHSAATAYYLIVLSVYGVIATSAKPLALLAQVVPNVAEGPAAASPALVAAFVLGALLPRVPAIAEIDQWCRQRLQEMAAIPNEVRRLAAEMRRARFAPSDHLQEQARSFVESLGIDPAYLDFTDSAGPRQAWTKLTVLRVVLDQWEEDRKFSGFMSRFRQEAEDVKQRYTRLTAKAKVAMQMIAGGGDAPSDHRHLHAVNAYVGDFRDQTMECIQATTTFMSRALLKCDMTHAARVADLRSIGFCVTSADRRFALDELLLIGLFAWLIILFCFVSIPGLATSTSIEELLARTLMIAVIYSVAVACAMYEREYRPASLPRARVRPIGRYLVVAIVASGAGLLVSLWFHVVILGGFRLGFARIRVVYPWFVLTFLTAFTTAFCLDNTPRGSITRTRLRLLEGTAMALVMSIAAIGVRMWLFENSMEAPVRGTYVPPPLAGVVIISSSIGHFIGTFVPTWYRDAPRTVRVACDEADVAHNGEPPGLHLTLPTVGGMSLDRSRFGLAENPAQLPPV